MRSVEGYADVFAHRLELIVMSVKIFRAQSQRIDKLVVEVVAKLLRTVLQYRVIVRDVVSDERRSSRELIKVGDDLSDRKSVV